jgi:hypothetical protein
VYSLSLYSFSSCAFTLNTPPFHFSQAVLLFGNDASPLHHKTTRIIFLCQGKDCRLWDWFQNKPYALLDTPSKTLQDAQVR